MTPVASHTWFVRHEIRLAWRDWIAMVTAGRAGRTRNVTIALIAFALFMHLLAYAVVGRFAQSASIDDKTTLIVATVSIFLAWALILSQAIESVTRTFYSRADLDLIVSSPANLTNIFSVRMGAIALSVTAMALLLSMPFIDVLAICGGSQWLAAYGVIAAAGISAAAVAIVFTVALFHAIGPKQTRLVAQIFAVIVGAGFVIVLQIAAILSYGTLSRYAVLTSHSVLSRAPDIQSILWWPVRAMFGDVAAVFALLSASLLLLGTTMAILSPRLGEDIKKASAASVVAGRRIREAKSFRTASRQQALRRKEFMLLRRDPWLISQTLMQLLYLLPPVVMLWRSFADSAGTLIILTPVAVMAAGQLAGGLAWLTISGEDAPDLVATAPVSASDLMRSKIEVVLIVVAIAFSPLALPLVFVSPLQAAVTSFGITIAALSATAIQLWFRVQARRSQFRRRQTSSRVATFSEAFSSIGWAATAALALLVPLAAIITGLMTIGMLAVTWKISPDRSSS